MNRIKKLSKSVRQASHVTPLIALSLASGVVQAQVEGEAPVVQGDSLVIEEVVVTALRRAEGTALSDTPISVDAMTGADLESQGFTSVMDAIATNPGVSIGKSVGVGESVQIRGISGIVGDATVGYYLDGLPYTRLGSTIAPDLNPYDLNRVEVLRGPQGTLFGAGSLGGTVRILTHDPVMDEFSGKVTGGLSTTDGGGDNWRLQAAVNAPIIEDVLAIRLVGSTLEDDGYIDLPLVGEDDYNELEKESYRGKLKWTPNADWSVLGSYWHWEQDGYQNWADDDYEAFPVFLELDTGALRPVGGKWLYADNENDLYGLTIKHSADSFRFTSATSYLEGSYVWGAAIAGFHVEDSFDDIETFTQEFSLVSINDGPWNWTAGAIYMDMENQTTSTTGFFASFSEGPVQQIINGDKLESESWAIFGESIHEIGDDWEMTLGARYFYDERELTENDPLFEPLYPLLGLENPRDEDWDRWTGRFNLAWRPTDFSLYYLNIAQGFRSGGLNPGGDLLQAGSIGLEPPLEVDPDVVTSYELGGKWTLLDGDLELEAAAYYLDWDDIQTFVTVPGPTGDLIGWADNASEAVGMGVEFGVTYRSGGLVLTAAGNFNETEYDGDVPSAGIFDGDQVTMVPETTLSASASYLWPVGEMNGTAFLGVNYTDERADYSPPDFEHVSDSLTVATARVGLEANRWSAYLTADNLLDEDGDATQLAALTQVGVEPNRLRPRTFGVEVSFFF